MVGRVLNGNGITELLQGRYRLIGSVSVRLLSSSRAERRRARRTVAAVPPAAGCFSGAGREEVFAHRSRHRMPISGSIKDRVLTRARGRCECCGAHEHQRALKVDHIIPKTRGEARTRSAICRRCASGAMPASTTRPAPISAESRELPPTAGWLPLFYALEGGGRVLLENAFEALHRRRLPGDRRAQPGDSQAARRRWTGAASPRMECRGGAAQATQGATGGPGSNDQRLECGAEFR